MAKLSEYAFFASMLMTAFALVLYVVYAVSGLRAARMQTAMRRSFCRLLPKEQPLPIETQPTTVEIGLNAAIVAVEGECPLRGSECAGEIPSGEPRSGQP